MSDGLYGVVEYGRTRRMPRSASRRSSRWSRPARSSWRRRPGSSRSSSRSTTRCGRGRIPHHVIAVEAVVTWCGPSLFANHLQPRLPSCDEASSFFSRCDHALTSSCADVRVVQAESAFVSELEAQRRLASVHESNAKDAQAKSEALLKELKSRNQIYDEQVGRGRCSGWPMLLSKRGPLQGSVRSGRQRVI